MIRRTALLPLEIPAPYTLPPLGLAISPGKPEPVQPKFRTSGGFRVRFTSANGLNVVSRHRLAMETAYPVRRWPLQWFAWARPVGGRIWGAPRAARGGLAGCVRRLCRHALRGGAVASGSY